MSVHTCTKKIKELSGMRTEVMTMGDFLNRDHLDSATLLDRILDHLNKHKIAYQVVGFTLIILTSSSTVFAATGIDAGGKAIYSKLVNIGKWVIIFKGGWDTIMNTVRGDFDSAKKSFMQYLLIYVVLLALPWSLDQVDSVFKGL
jgi:hypothetical protein